MLNAAFYTVKSIEPLIVESEEGQDIPIDVKEFHYFLRHAAAMVYIVAQGRTLDGTVCLWETNSQHFSRQALVVGLSRARHHSLVSIH